MIDFYGVHLDTPQSAYNNTEKWSLSQVAKLNSMTKGQIYIKQIPVHQVGAMCAWKVVWAEWLDEDTTLTRFRAFGVDGQHLPFATFGVTWAGCEQRIGGGFKYPPEAGNMYYVPVDGMHTPNQGGYTVVVLDQAYPSEGLAFGSFNTQDGHHKALLIDFQLMTISSSYPNDVEV